MQNGGSFTFCDMVIIYSKNRTSIIVLSPVRRQKTYLQDGLATKN